MKFLSIKNTDIKNELTKIKKMSRNYRPVLLEPRGGQVQNCSGFWNPTSASARLSSLLGPRGGQVLNCHRFGSSLWSNAELSSWGSIAELSRFWSLKVAKCRAVIAFGSSYLRRAELPRIPTGHLRI